MLEDSSNTSSISSSDTNAFVSEASLQSQPITSATVRDALVDVEKELQSKSLAEDQEVEAVENILDQEIITDTGGSPVQANSSTIGHQEVLAERARFVARAREDLRFGSKMLSKQIRHRLLTREIGSMMAVAAGDEEQEQAPSYSV
ncbi:hypothetical protein [Rickettsia gravesii]|uniref:hypothetical protein n=1 Tax=Rickettsia gravesii TaxID=354585 RepID=UPI00037AF312|nr:hypothetical protein [Rickettsia gravesii]